MPSVGDICYRRAGGVYLTLPPRVRLSDGTTRTDPAQYSLDAAVMADLGYEISTLTEADLAAMFPPPPPPPEPTPLEAGYDTGLGWRLAWQPDDVALLTGLYVLAQRADQLGLVQPVVVTDTEGQQHEMTFAEFDTLMLGYGAARAALSAEPVEVLP